MASGADEALTQAIIKEGGVARFADGGREALVAWMESRRSEPTFFEDLTPILEFAIDLESSPRNAPLALELIDLVNDTRKPEHLKQKIRVRAREFPEETAARFGKQFGGETSDGEAPKRRGSLGWNDSE